MNEYAGIVMIALASGRVAYSVAREEIFRPLREFVYRRSSPSNDTDIYNQPWRMIHWYKTNKRERAQGLKNIEYEFDATVLRDPGFFGQLVECPYCLSFWVTLIMILLSILVQPLVFVLALWSLSSLVVRILP